MIKMAHLWECLEVVVSVDHEAISWLNFPKNLSRKKFKSSSVSHLHPHHPIYEENDGNEGGDPWQSLEGLHEGEKQGSDSFPLRQQFHHPEDSEEAEEGNGYHVARLEKYMESKRPDWRDMECKKFARLISSSPGFDSW